MVHQQMMHENTTESSSARTVSLGTEAVSLGVEQSARSGRTADRVRLIRWSNYVRAREDEVTCSIDRQQY